MNLFQEKAKLTNEKLVSAATGMAKAKIISIMNTKPNLSDNGFTVYSEAAKYISLEWVCYCGYRFCRLCRNFSNHIHIFHSLTMKEWVMK